MDKDKKEKRKKSIKFHKAKRSSPEYKLHILLHRKITNIEPRHLVLIVSKTEYPLKLRKRLLKEFLNRKNTNFSNFYEMSNVARDIFEEDKELKKIFFEQCFEICDEHNLEELASAGVMEAQTELDGRINEGSISNRSATQLLIARFRRTGRLEEKELIALWRRLRRFHPSRDDLKIILDLAYEKGERGIRQITSEIEKILRHTDKEWDKTISDKRSLKILLEIEKLVAQIKKEQD